MEQGLTIRFADTRKAAMICDERTLRLNWRGFPAASRAYTDLNRPAGKGNPSYDTQLIEIAGILGIAHANLGRTEEAQRALDMLDAIKTTGQIYGPEKFIAIARIYMAQKQYDKALAAVQNPEAFDQPEHVQPTEAGAAGSMGQPAPGCPADRWVPSRRSASCFM